MSDGSFIFSLSQMDDYLPLYLGMTVKDRIWGGEDLKRLNDFRIKDWNYKLGAFC